MISNERQYQITRTRIEEFKRALAGLKESHAGDELWLTIQRNAITSQLEEMQEEVREYEALPTKRVPNKR